MGLTQAIERAIAKEDQEYAATRWSDAISSAGLPPPRGGMRFGTRLVDSRTVRVAAAPIAPRRRDETPGARMARVRGGARRHGATIRQTVVFDPVGLPGLMYWHAVYPLHGRVSAGMLRGIAKYASR